MGYFERSMLATAPQCPQLWGPGPWDEDDTTWAQKAHSCGDLRAWDPSAGLAGGRIRTVSSDPPDRAAVDPRTNSRADGRKPRIQAGLLVQCWCRSTITMVDPELVAACVTVSCGMPICHGPESVGCN